MSQDESDAEYIARQFVGGRSPDQEFVDEGRQLFTVNIAIAAFKRFVPDLAERRAFVDKFVTAMQQKADQELAEHRQRVEGSAIGKLLGAVSGDPEKLAADTEQRFAYLRNHLYAIVE